MVAHVFEARVHDAPGKAGVVVVDLFGDIDVAAQGTLNRAYAEANRREPSAIVLNLAEVDYINSAGIALIVSLLTQARKAGCHLLTYGLSPHYLKIFQITRLSEYMGIYADEASAVAAAPRAMPIAQPA